MKTIKHNIEVNIQSISGIEVWDGKRDDYSSSRSSRRKLNKITAILSFSRNKKTASTGSSLPLQPAGIEIGNDNNGNGYGSLYKAKWEHEHEHEHEKKSSSTCSMNTIVFETNLHPVKKNAGIIAAFEPKHFQIMVGLQRKEDFIILGASLLTINDPVDYADIILPLRHPNTRNGTQQYFHNDNANASASARGFSLASDARIVARISVTAAIHSSSATSKLFGVWCALFWDLLT
jgi:hypothetical protein